MTWYVRCGHRILGTVIASDEAEALALAYAKYPPWDGDKYEVEARKR